MQYKVTGTVPAPDGQGEMFRVEVRVGDTEIVWLTRDSDSIEPRLSAFEQRLLESSATRAGVLDEETDSQANCGVDGAHAPGRVVPEGEGLEG